MPLDPAVPCASPSVLRVLVSSAHCCGGKQRLAGRRAAPRRQRWWQVPPGRPGPPGLGLGGNICHGSPPSVHPPWL